MLLGKRQWEPKTIRLPDKLKNKNNNKNYKAKSDRIVYFAIEMGKSRTINVIHIYESKIQYEDEGMESLYEKKKNDNWKSRSLR